jgi:3-oxoadipate enol-lactonase
MKAVVNSNDVYWVDVGPPDAFPVVLIHGFPFSHEMWDPQIDLLRDRFRVIAYDLRGHGMSGIGDGQYTLEFFVDDLLGLLDHLKIEKAVFCGLSMGGYIALRSIERNAERVAALILADTQAKADSNEAKLKRSAAIKSVKTNGVKAYAEGFVKSIFTPQTLTSNRASYEKIKQLIEKNQPLGICGALLALASRTDTTEALSGIKVPTLILVGENDVLTPPSASQEMRNRIPQSNYHMIQNAAHLSNLENTEEFNKYVFSFLRTLEI